MGCSLESIRALLQQLRDRPHTINWSSPQPVVLHRGAENKLGFRFKTLQPCGAEPGETITVVVQVKTDCCINEGALHVGDRIVSVGPLLVTRLDETEVKHVFSQSQSSSVHLQVSAMSWADTANTQVKRILSTNSGASGSSISASVDSSERPQVKRFQKSSSTETPPSPLSASSYPGSPSYPLSPLSYPVSPDHCPASPSKCPVAPCNYRGLSNNHPASPNNYSVSSANYLASPANCNTSPAAVLLAKCPVSAANCCNSSNVPFPPSASAYQDLAANGSTLPATSSPVNSAGCVLHATCSALHTTPSAALPSSSTCCALPVTCSPLRATGSVLHSSSCASSSGSNSPAICPRLPAACCALPTTYSGFHSSYPASPSTCSSTLSSSSSAAPLLCSTNVASSPASSASHGCGQGGVGVSSPSRLPPSTPRGQGFRLPRYLIDKAHTTNTSSLPAKMEDDIILTDDIVLCETDGTSSLPPVLTRHPNTPTPSLGQHSGSAFVNTVSTGIGGATSGEVVAGPGAAYHRSLGVEVCRAPGCNAQKLCLWHKFVLTFPQYVVWEAFTKTVMLEKHGNSSFGFKYKVKKYDGPPAEVFALVTEVLSGGVAWTLLLSGDWIRSINGSAVNSVKEAFRPDFRSLSSLRLVIQRPEGLSPKGISKLKQLARTMRINLYIPPPMPSDNSPSPQYINSVRPASSNQNSAFSEQSVRKAGMEGGVQGENVPTGTVHDPLLDQYPHVSPGEHIPLSTLSRPLLQRSPSASSRCVLPQARVVVCGAHGSAADFVRGLLGEGISTETNPDSHVQTFQLSLQRGADMETCVRNFPEALSNLIKEQDCGGVGSPGSSSQEGDGGVRSLNVDLYVISDEKFFHHCSTWLLPTSTLLILTFQVHKLLNQPQVETRRLAGMANTARACCQGNASPHPQVLLYGVPSGSQRDVSPEEIQGMFYVTDSGSRLLEQNCMAVNVAVPACGRSMSAARQHLFSVCQDHLAHSPVPQCVARVLDSLSMVAGVQISGHEVCSVVSRVLGDSGDPETVQSVVNCLVVTGSLIVCGTSRSTVVGEEQEYLVPLKLFQAVSSFFIKPLLDTDSTDNRQKWFKLMASSHISKPELLDLLASESSSLTAQILERLGIAFKFHPTHAGRGDSGFAEDAGDYVIPYFLQDSMEGEGDGEGFVVRFQRSVSWQGYYDMLCKLSGLSGTEEVTVKSQCDCVVRHNKHQLTLHWRKESACDSIFVAVHRAHQGRDRVSVQYLEGVFNSVVPPSLSFKVHTVDASHPSSNLPSRPPFTLSPALPTPPKPSAQNPISEEEETLVKPVVDVVEEEEEVGEEVGEEEVEERGVYSRLPLTALPWSVLNQAAIMLTVSMPTGHDWKSVAECAGKSVAEIYAYENISTREVPAMSFLREWMLTGTVQQILDILHTLDRPDVRGLILAHLRQRQDGS